MQSSFADTLDKQTDLLEKGITSQRQTLQTLKKIEIPLPLTRTNYNTQTFS